MSMRGFLAALMVAALVGAAPAGAQEGSSDPDALVGNAETTIRNFANDPDLAWFRNNVGDAKALLIVPTLVKGGFFLGGSGGSGALLARDGESGTWSPPAFYTMGSVSFGLQIGAEVAEVVLMVMTDRGLDSMLSTSLKLGGDVSIAAGPVGAGAKAATADVLAFSRSKGVYGGISFEGSVIATRDEWNRDYYGQDASPRQILIERAVSNPEAEPLRTTVAEVAGTS